MIGRPPRSTRKYTYFPDTTLLRSHGRTEAILELEAPQVRDGIIYFNPPGRMQTKKRRSTVPVAPSLRPWLAGASGKIIRYQTPLAKSSWADPAVPEYHERPCYGIRKAFDACLMEAGIRSPRSDEHTSELQSLMRISYAVFCLQ